MNSATDMTVANEILAQLGGRRFIAMTGARNILGSADGLQLKLPSTPHFVKDGINSVSVKLDGSDTYTVTFHKIGRAPRFDVKLISEVSFVGSDSLRAVFTSATGLDTHL